MTHLARNPLQSRYMHGYSSLVSRQSAVQAFSDVQIILTFTLGLFNSPIGLQLALSMDMARRMKEDGFFLCLCGKLCCPNICIATLTSAAASHFRKVQ